MSAIVMIGHAEHMKGGIGAHTTMSTLIGGAVGGGHERWLEAALGVRGRARD